MNRLNPRLPNPFVTQFSKVTGDGHIEITENKDTTTEDIVKIDTADIPPPPYRSHGTATFSTSPHTPVEERKN